MQTSIQEYCRQLRIGRGFYEGYKEIHATTHEEFLLELLRREVASREVTRRNRLLKAAKFDVVKTFEGYSFDEVQIPPTLTLEEVRAAAFVEKQENLIFYGPPGTGKTHLATAIGVEACGRGKHVKFFRTASLVNHLTEAKADGELKRFFRQIQKCDLLICDEWGYIPFEKEGAQLLFQVVSECYEKRSIILTTNLEFSK